MPVLYIAVSFSVLVGCYLLVSKKDKSYLNVLTVSFLFFIPSNYFLELMGIYIFGIKGSEFSYFFVYLTYAFYYLALTIGYVFSNPPFISLPLSGKRYNFYFLAILFFCLGIALYLPVLWEFKDQLGDPRAIYTSTRTGYGIYFYLSSTLIYLGFILFLFKGQVVLPLLICTFVSFFKGSKTHLLTPFLILIIYQVYVMGKRVRFLKSVGYISIFLFLIIISFLANTFSSSDTLSLFEKFYGYGDTTRNSALVIDHFTDFKWGRLNFEEAFYQRIPRLLFPNKPKDFGAFYLAKEFYPEEFERDVGAPAFGLVGLPFADFGYFSIFYLILLGFLTGYVMNFFKKRLYLSKSPGDFIMFSFFSGINLLSMGPYLLPDHFLLALIISAFLTKKIPFISKMKFV